MRVLCRSIADSPRFQKFVVGLILVNAIVLGMETSTALMSQWGDLLIAIDHSILYFFVVELLIRIVAHGIKFFRDPWSLFDLFVVIISFLPAQEAFSVLRALRVLRVLRLVSALPRLRTVVQGFIIAIPGIGSVAMIMSLIFYIFSILATKLYGQAFPEWFGSLGDSLFSLFQIMTLEGWADMVRTMLVTHPNSWIFFVVYILVATFTVLNLFIAVMVDSMQSAHKARDEAELVLETSQSATLEEIRTELRALRAELNARRDKLG